MMKKPILLIFIVLLILVASCQKPKIRKSEVPRAATDAIVDTVGSDLNNVDDIEKDLNPDEISEMDSGFDDVQNI